MTSLAVHYPIGIPGVAWGDGEVSAWLAQQTRKRSFSADVLPRIEQLRSRFDVSQYGTLACPPDD
ncbi:MAG TPA: peptidase, partial [Rudaea sp.]|nr:peptidase [Rudaea sp.]